MAQTQNTRWISSHTVHSTQYTEQGARIWLCVSDVLYVCLYMHVCLLAYIFTCICKHMRVENGPLFSLLCTAFQSFPSRCLHRTWLCFMIMSLTHIHIHTEVGRIGCRCNLIARLQMYSCNDPLCVHECGALVMFDVSVQRMILRENRFYFEKFSRSTPTDRILLSAHTLQHTYTYRARTHKLKNELMHTAASIAQTQRYHQMTQLIHWFHWYSFILFRPFILSFLHHSRLYFAFSFTQLY